MVKCLFCTAFFISLFFFSSTEAVESGTPVTLIPLTDEKILELQTQRLLHREDLIEKNKFIVPLEGVPPKKEQSQLYYETALIEYENGNYHESRKYFEAALFLRPQDDQIFFDYGKCLFRQGANKMALSVFLMLENNPIYKIDATYYQALGYLRFKNFDLALQKFKSIQEESNVELASTAAFYSGQIYFQQQNYPDAKKSFEFLIDHSKDAKLDAEAEKYLEQIAFQERLQAKLDKKFGYSLNLGLLYDENVLNIAAQNSATSLKAYRLNYGGHVFFHVVNTAKSQWSPTFNFSDMYSLSTELKSDPTIQSTDPMLLDFSFPYRSDFSIGKASSTLTVSPALQLIYMTKNTSARELVFQNYTLTTALTIGHTAALTSTYKIYLTKENSNYTVSFPDDNQNTQKTMVTVSNYYLLDKDYNENAIFELSYLLNKADGVNISYRKPTATLGYVRTFATKWTLYAKADYSSADYYESSFSRKDSTSAFSINTSYSLNAADNVNLGLQYQKNNSNNDVYNYSKFIFSLGYSISHF